MASSMGVNRITEGVIWKQLLAFFFPILLGSFFQQCYNTVDMVIVGRFVGTDALAAVGGSSGQILNLIIGFFTGLSAGAGVIISQYFGSGSVQKMTDSMHTAYAFCVVGGLVFTVLGLLFSPSVLRWMNTPAETLEASTAYLRIYFAGILFVFVYNIGSGILRALGNSKQPLYFLIVCCVLNIVLDLLFVVVFRLGVVGVAWATLLAQAVSAVLVTLALMKLPFCDFHLLNIRFYWYTLKPQLTIGVPSGVQSVMYSLSNIIIQTAVNSFGTNASAAWATDAKIEAIFWMINGAYSVSITTFAGQNYGAGRMDRLDQGTKICLLMHLGTSLAIGTVFYLFAEPLFFIFTSDPEVIAYGVLIMRMICPFFFLFSFIEIYSSVLRSLNDVFIPMLITLVGVCALRFFWMLVVFPLHPTYETIIVNYPLTWSVTAIAFIIYYRIKHRAFAKRKFSS